VTEAEARAAIVREARSWVGTPFRHAARLRGAGADCGGLLLGVYSAVGLLPEGLEVPIYSPEFMKHRGDEWLLDLVEKYAHRVDRAPLPGDIVLYRFGRCVSHSAIVTAWPEVIHAWGTAVVPDDERNPALAERRVGVWSLWPCPA